MSQQPEDGPDRRQSQSLRQRRAAFVEALREAGVDSPELDARLLMSHALGLSDMAFFTSGERVLQPDELERIDALQQRRLKREPVSRITGTRGFWKHDFALAPETLDPRPDSETLIEAALDLLSKNRPSKNRQSGNGRRKDKPEQGGEAALSDEGLRILDLGAGSGALLVSLLMELPQASGLGVDIQPGAVDMARRNAERLGCAGRAAFRVGDWLEGIDERFDIILCNPPYIPSDDIDALEPEVSRHEPRLALDGGADGLAPYRLILPLLQQTLKENGVALFEFGEGQHQQISDLAAKEGLLPAGDQHGLYMDLAGRWRVIALTSAACWGRDNLITFGENKTK